MPQPGESPASSSRSNVTSTAKLHQPKEKFVSTSFSQLVTTLVIAKETNTMIPGNKKRDTGWEATLDRWPGVCSTDRKAQCPEGRRATVDVLGMSVTLGIARGFERLCYNEQGQKGTQVKEEGRLSPVTVTNSQGSILSH